MTITIRNILVNFPKLDRDTGKLVYHLLIGKVNSKDYLLAKGLSFSSQTQAKPENILRAIDDILDNHGIEAVKGEGYTNSYWGDTSILYSNSGSTYSPTFLYDVIKDKFYLTALGIYLERCKYGFV